MQPDGLRRTYVANLVDFLWRAKANGIYVLISAEALPYGSSYETLANTDQGANFGGENTQYLTANGAEGHRHFWTALIQAMKSIGAPLDTVWGYEIVSEQFYRDTSPPLNLGAGLVSTGNGSIYDMAIAGQKQLMMDENLAWWAGRVRTAILAVDPTALVGMGFLWPKGPNPARAGDSRVVRARPVIDSSSPRLLRHPSASRRRAHLPAVHGELRADDAGGQADRAGRVRRIQVRVSGRVRRRPDPEKRPGGLVRIRRGRMAALDLETNTTEYGPGELPLWNGDASASVINQGLGPLLRPDPCAAVPGAGNLALGKPVTASATEAGSSVTHVVDGLMANSWSSGGYPGQWIEIDLGAPVPVARVRLFVTQYPNGATTHHILTRATTGDAWTDQHIFTGVTSDGDVLEYEPASAMDERPLRADRHHLERLLGRVEGNRGLRAIGRRSV